jgi:hypothetical protein
MDDQVFLYISATPDPSPEREVLGRAVTELPVDIGWRIVHSARGGQAVDLEAVLGAHVHVLVMGSDIRAPVGWEWRVARTAGKQPVPYLKEDVLHTPAGIEFARHIAAQAKWRRFSDAADLRRQILQLLADHLLTSAGRYGLMLNEIERLESWQSEPEPEREEPDLKPHGGAGEGSVILSVQRFRPSEGVPISGKETEGEDSGG